MSRFLPKVSKTYLCTLEEYGHAGYGFILQTCRILHSNDGFCRFYYLLRSLKTRVKHMQPQRETLTDSLADIIQILQIGFRSGTLTVERGEGRGLEEGYLIFVNGRIVDARTGQYTNWSAFNYLKTWGSCRFSFDSDTATPLTPAPPAPPMNGNGRASGSGPMNGYALGDSMAITPPSFPTNQPGSLTRIPVRLQAGEVALLHPDSTGASTRASPFTSAH